MIGEMRRWLKRHLRARKTFVDALILIVFIGSYNIIKDIGRAYGWWPKSFLISIIINVALGIVIGLVFLLMWPRSKP